MLSVSTSKMSGIRQGTPEVSRSREARKSVESNKSQNVSGISLPAEEPTTLTQSGREYILTCIGVTVGLGNIWRFPNLAFRNGCGTFIICYTVMLLFIGFPLYYMEVLLGQFTSRGPYFCFSTLAPVTTGVAVTIGLAGLCVALYYNTIVAYFIYYLYVLTWPQLPWLKCDDSWGADVNCFSRQNRTEVKEYLSCAPNNSDFEGLIFSGSKLYSCRNMSSAGQQFFQKVIRSHYQTESGVTLQSVTLLNYHLAICLLIAWCLVYLSVCTGIEKSSKLFFYVTVIPEILLLTLFVVVFVTKGGIYGMFYLFKPQWSKFIDFKVWMYAGVEVFFSLGIGYGYIIMFNSFRPFHNDAHRDSVLLTSVDFITSILSACVVFGLAGHLSEITDIPIEYFSDSIFEITFALCPEALSNFDIPRLSIAIFFILLASAGMDTLFTQVISLHHVLYDCSTFLSKHRILTPLISCFLCFLVNIVFVTEAGLHAIKILDYYVTGRVILILASAEMITVSYVYGINKFCRDIQFMTHSPPNIYYEVMWGIVTPLMLMIMLSVAWLGLSDEFVNGERAIYGYVFPTWAVYVGTAIAAVISLQIPLWAFVAILYYRRLHITKLAFQPTDHWLPFHEQNQKDYLDFINPPFQGCDSDLELCPAHVPQPTEDGQVYLKTYKYRDRVFIFPNKINKQVFSLTDSSMELS